MTLLQLNSLRTIDIIRCWWRLVLIKIKSVRSINFVGFFLSSVYWYQFDLLSIYLQAVRIYNYHPFCENIRSFGVQWNMCTFVFACLYLNALFVQIYLCTHVLSVGIPLTNLAGLMFDRSVNKAVYLNLKFKQIIIRENRNIFLKMNLIYKCTSDD
jgi:hypothetical protein